MNLTAEHGWPGKDKYMTKSLLIDARQAEETRVVLLSGTRIEDFDYETENRKQLKGNVYLARVTRVEPSLQAAFVEYGGNRQGFLAGAARGFSPHSQHLPCPINTLSEVDSRTWLAGERQAHDKTPINRCTPDRGNSGGAAKRNTH